MSGAARIPISKRQRFEIFKRDDFTCQYCGATPPGSILEVDHIVPVASGGTNEDHNLVTACWDCNRGKAAIGLEIVPQSLADKAAEVAEREEQLLGYNAILQSKRERLEDETWDIVRAWTNQEETRKDYFSSLKRFVDKLGFHEVLDAVEIMQRANIRSERRQFLYICKVCWNKIGSSEQ